MAEPTKITIEAVAEVVEGHEEPGDDFQGGVQSVIRMRENFPPETLQGLGAFSHLQVLWHFNRASPKDVALHARSPRNNPDWPPTGTFVHRNHRRPNQLAVSHPRLVRIQGRDLYVTDLDAAETFYTDILGLERIAKADGRHVFFRCGDGVLLLFNAEATKELPSPDAKLPVPPHGSVGQGHLCFTASGDEIDRWKDRLSRKGIAIEADFHWPAKSGQERGGRSIYFRDPSGNSLEFAEPKIWGL